MFEEVDIVIVGKNDLLYKGGIIYMVQMRTCSYRINGNVFVQYK